jgi:uncharacterized protein (UPF0335 family)
MTTEPSPAEQAAWADIRARYEKGEEPLQSVAQAAGLSAITLSMKAKALGWLLRTRRKTVAPQGTKRESTQATLKRLKDLLQSRIQVLEKEINAISDEVSELGNERSVRAVNTLVRTLEKVLDLERKDSLRRRRATAKFKHFDDAARAALAAKIEGLQRQWRGTDDLPSLEQIRDGWIEPRLDPVGPQEAAAAGEHEFPDVADSGGPGGGEDKGRS